MVKVSCLCIFLKPFYFCIDWNVSRCPVIELSFTETSAVFCTKSICLLLLWKSNKNGECVRFWLQFHFDIDVYLQVLSLIWPMYRALAQWAQLHKRVNNGPKSRNRGVLAAVTVSTVLRMLCWNIAVYLVLVSCSLFKHVSRDNYFSVSFVDESLQAANANR